MCAAALGTKLSLSMSINFQHCLTSLPASRQSMYVSAALRLKGGGCCGITSIEYAQSAIGNRGGDLSVNSTVASIFVKVDVSPRHRWAQTLKRAMSICGIQIGGCIHLS